MMYRGEQCYIDMKNDREVVQHFRDLINVGPLLEMDVNEEIWKFKLKCVEAEYTMETVEELVKKACIGTVYEQYLPDMTDGMHS